MWLLYLVSWVAAGVFCIRSTLSSCHPLDSIEDTLLDCAADFLPRAPESTAAQTYKNIIEIIVAAANPETAAAAGDALVVHNPAGTTPSGLNLAINASIWRCHRPVRRPLSTAHKQSRLSNARAQTT